jgi:hypothetical protein
LGPALSYAGSHPGRVLQTKEGVAVAFENIYNLQPKRKRSKIMPRVIYEIYNMAEAEDNGYLKGILKAIRRKGIVSSFGLRYHIIVARHGVNKTTLKKILRKELNKNG